MKTALITGASSGIGMELAKIHAQKGDNLVLVARNAASLRQLADELAGRHNINAEVIPADLSRENAAREVYEQVNQKGLTIDYLVNNAGFGDFSFLHESNWEKQAMMMDLNIKSLVHLTHLFLPHFVARKSGRVLNVASTAAFLPCPMMAVYGATKHFVLAFSEAVANEVADKGVTVTALCPGATRSGFQDAAEMLESGFMTNVKFATAESVAQYGYRSMMKGKRVAIPGVFNKFSAGIVRFTPRRMVTSIARKMIDKK